MWYAGIGDEYYLGFNAVAIRAATSYKWYLLNVSVGPGIAALIRYCSATRNAAHVGCGGA